jgi:parallel beta helix pectate lyase-like protein
VLGLAAPASAATIQATCPTLAADLQNAAAGDVVILPDAPCDLAQIIRPASGIAVRGVPGSLLRVAFPGTSTYPLFELSGLADIEFGGFEIELGLNARGFRATTGGAFRFLDIRVRGNLLAGDTSSLAFDFRGVNDVEAIGVTIEENFGGFYANGVSRLLVERFRTRRVNFGNLVVSGTNIVIRNITLEEPGFPSASHHPSGDGITLGESTDVLIDGAYFVRGRCYLINGPSGLVTRLTVRNSTFISGTTSAIRLANVVDSEISANSFRDNGGHGVAITVAQGVTVAHNVFRRDTLYLGNSTNGAYVDNFFSGAGPTPIRGTGATDVVAGNRIVP